MEVMRPARSTFTIGIDVDEPYEPGVRSICDILDEVIALSRTLSVVTAPSWIFGVVIAPS